MTVPNGISLCRSCGGRDLRVFLSLGDMPLSDGLLAPDELQQEEPRYPLDVAFCPDCALVQILETVPPERLFGADYPYFSSFTDTLLRHSAANVAARIAEQGLDGNSLVVELASNDGYLLQYYREQAFPCSASIPPRGRSRRRAPAASRRCKRSSVASWRSSSPPTAAAPTSSMPTTCWRTSRTRTGSSQGMSDAAQGRRDGRDRGPYVRELIDHGEFDTIYHEHLCYFSVTALGGSFRRHGLR